jgi:hypothetical protein
MKTKKEIYLTFGDLIAAACQVWGTEQGEKMVRLAISTRLVVFRAPPLFLNPPATGRPA